MRIKICFHWKKLGKTFLIFFLLAIALFLLFIGTEVSPITAAIIGVVVGGMAATICHNNWTLWHFEIID